MSESSLHNKSELASLLSHNIGVEKANELVDVAARELRCGDELTVAQALEILEHIAAQPGIVGISARFAKSRVLLRWGNER